MPARQTSPAARPRPAPHNHIGSQNASSGLEFRRVPEQRSLTIDDLRGFRARENEVALIETRYRGENVMLAQHVLRQLRRHGLTHALAGLIVMVAASGLATPAIAQISIGIRMGMGANMVFPPMPE